MNMEKLMEGELAGETEVLGENPPYDLNLDRTRSATAAVFPVMNDG
jgi:hypothetical protein